MKLTVVNGGHQARPRGARVPFVERRRQGRAAARALVRARTRRGLTAEQRAYDPLARPRRGAGARAGIALLALLGAAGIHVAVVGISALIGGQEQGRRERIEQVVRVEVREPPPPPPPPVEEKKAEPPPLEKPTRPPPLKVAKTPPPPAPTPAPTPTRVVGLSMESTTEGGNGPAFAVGNTRDGQTAAKAIAPSDIPKTDTPPPPPPAATRNAAASRIPVAGVVFVEAKFKGPRKPPVYPPTLKVQGIEGDVPVVLSVSATGKVTHVKIVKPSTYPEFDQAVRAVAMTQEIEPATRDGVPVPYEMSFTYRFRLEDE